MRSTIDAEYIGTSKKVATALLKFHICKDSLGLSVSLDFEERINVVVMQINKITCR